MKFLVPIIIIGCSVIVCVGFWGNWLLVGLAVVATLLCLTQAPRKGF